MALLGAILTNNTAYDRVAHIVRPEHFADQRHGKVFEAIANLRRRGLVADPITLSEHFAAFGTLDDLGGGAYLARLAASTVSVINAEDYAWVIWDRSVRRDLIFLAESYSQRVYDIGLEDTADKIAAELIGEVTNVLGTAGGAGPVRIFDVAQAALDSALAAHKAGHAIVGVATRIEEIDNVLGGLKPGRFYVIGGRPGMGKTTFIKNICANAAAAGDPVALFELEEAQDEVGAGTLAVSTGISASTILQGKFKTEQYSDLVDAQELMRDWPYFVDTTPGLSVAEITARARTLRPRPKVIVVDHLHIVNGDAPGRQYRGVTEKVGATSGALKKMAKQLNAAVIALAQMPRPEKGKEDRRPLLEDLRWAGEIEQDADVVAFLYRPHYYLDSVPLKERDVQWQKDHEATENLTEFILRKVRGGPGANKTIECFYNPATGVFTNKRADQQEAQTSFDDKVIG